MHRIHVCVISIPCSNPEYFRYLFKNLLVLKILLVVKILDLGIRVWDLVCREDSGDISLQSGGSCRGIVI